MPAGLDAAEAATLILSWMTAYQLLHRAGRVQPGQRVLVHGAAGAVGQALLVLGSMAGLQLWGGAHGRHAALIRGLGATPIDYQREDFTRVLPGGFDVVFNGIAEDGYPRRPTAGHPRARRSAEAIPSRVGPTTRKPDRRGINDRSASPPKADLRRHRFDVRKAPILLLRIDLLARDRAQQACDHHAVIRRGRRSSTR